MSVRTDVIIGTGPEAVLTSFYNLDSNPEMRVCTKRSSDGKTWDRDKPVNVVAAPTERGWTEEDTPRGKAKIEFQTAAEIRADLRKKQIFGVGEELDDEDLEAISRAGYHIGRRVDNDHGNTRISVEAEYVKGNVQRTVALKIPKRIVNQKSVRTRINSRKGDLNLKEAQVTSELAHPNIVSIFDSFYLRDGRTLNAEELGGDDLESLIEKTGPMLSGGERVDNIGIQMLRAVEHAHRKGIIHRDIKPGNILLDRDGVVKVSDWQTAAKSYDVFDSICPTMGAAEFGSPSVINPIFGGKEARASERSDIYSVGATLFYLLTEKSPVRYQIVQDPKGKHEVKIGDEKCRVSLLEDGKEIDEIDLKTHRRKIRTAIKSVPWKYRAFLRRALDPTQEYSTGQALADFEKIGKSWKGRTLEKTLRYSKIIGLTGVGSFLAGLGVYCGIFFQSQQEVPQRETTLRDIFRNQSQIEARFTGFPDEAALIRHNPDLPDYFEKNLKASKEKIEEVNKKYDNWLRGKGSHGWYEMSGVDQRLATSLVRSVLVEEGTKTPFYKGRDQKFLVPTEVIKANCSRDDFDKNGKLREDYDRGDGMRMLSLLRHTQRCFNIGKSLEDVYVEAVFDKDEIERAKSQAQIDYIRRNMFPTGTGFSAMARPGDLVSSENVNNFNYFPREEEKDGRTKMVPGFRNFLDPVRTRIVDRALVLYQITNEYGEVQWDSFNKPVKLPSRSRD